MGRRQAVPLKLIHSAPTRNNKRAKKSKLSQEGFEPTTFGFGNRCPLVWTTAHGRGIGVHTGLAETVHKALEVVVIQPHTQKSRERFRPLLTHYVELVSSTRFGAVERRCSFKRCDCRRTARVLVLLPEYSVLTMVWTTSYTRPRI